MKKKRVAFVDGFVSEVKMSERETLYGGRFRIVLFGFVSGIVDFKAEQDRWRIYIYKIK